MLQSSAVRSSARRAWARIVSPVRPEQLRSVLGTLTQGTDTLLVHSSLSACGYFTAGPDDVLCALGRLCDTCCLPTFTYCYPSSAGEAGPVFDRGSTASKMGLLTEIFRNQQGVVRSIHATHSLAVSGSRAGEISSDHHCLDAPCGSGSPFDRLVQRQASVLLFGVSFHSYTLFHTAEDASGSACAYENATLDRLRVIDETGRERDCWSRRQSRTPRRFEEAGDLLHSAGLARRVALGRGTLTFVPDCSKVHDFLVTRLKHTPDFLYQSCTRSLQ